jgi:hypothetical protein
LSKDPKQCSKKDGKTFLQECFSREQVVLKSKLDLSSNSITHDGTMGEVNEDHFIDFLKEHLPKRYCVDKGIAIDSKGHTSDQIDIIIYDNQYTPILLFQKSHRYIPAEAIYAVFECKSTINKSLLEYAWDKANTVRILHRTSVAIKHAGGTFPPGKPFPIMAGILSSNIEWADGFGKAFSKTYGTFQGARNLDCGVERQR